MFQPEPASFHLNKTKRTHYYGSGIDMTPMVDLGFLLITFFIFTTTMLRPNTTGLIMPADGEPSPVPESKVLTVLLGKNNKVIAYEGGWEEAIKNNTFILSSYHTHNGIGKLVRAKQRWMQQNNTTEGSAGLLMLIKPAQGATYKNVIDALDETIINDVKKYAIVDASLQETMYLEKLP